MRSTLWMLAVAGVVAFGGLFAASGLAHAGGCCGGGGARGYAPRAAQAGYSCCSPGSKAMGGMTQAAPAAYPQTWAAPQPAVPAAAGAAYFCPMHPNVVSSVPATCPLCQMALQRR